MIHVVFIEDRADLREAIQLEINRSYGLVCAATFPNFEDARLALEFNGTHGPLPDVVLLDLSLPGADGLEALGVVKARWPRIKVLVFSFHDEPEKVLAALNAGADGYLLKTTPQDELAAAIRRVHEGATALSPRVQELLVDYFRRRQPILPQLSPIEGKILRALDAGKTYKEVADEMGSSVNTVKTHAKRILVKSFAASMSEASFFRKQLI